jgi:hypothetical protein
VDGSAACVEENREMSDEALTGMVRKLDGRVARIEQFLPGLATREELQAAIAPLVTREELQAAIAPLATREELQAAIAPLATREEVHAAIAAAVAPLATRQEMSAAIRAEGDRARQHATMLFEDLRDDNRLILEHLLTLSAGVDALARR